MIILNSFFVWHGATAITSKFSVTSFFFWPQNSLVINCRVLNDGKNFNERSALRSITNLWNRCGRAVLCGSSRKLTDNKWAFLKFEWQKKLCCAQTKCVCDECILKATHVEPIVPRQSQMYLYLIIVYIYIIYLSVNAMPVGLSYLNFWRAVYWG